MNQLGQYTQPEIADQSAAMAAALSHLREQSGWISSYLSRPGVDEMIFIGSGSSWYQAQTMASVYRKWTGKPASALPSSELYLFREYAAAASGRNIVLIGVSRSGESSEVVLALESVKSLPGWTTCGITCYENSTMAKMAECLVSPLGKEESTVMTKSFSSMTYMMIAAIAMSTGREDLISTVSLVPGAAEIIVRKAGEFVPAFLHNRAFNKYIYLGMGPFFGLANEACLKIKEMANVWTESFGTLEFRHGPKSIVDEGTLVCLFLSETAREQELRVAREMKDYGATVLLLTARAGDDADFADAVFEVGMANADDATRCTLYLSPVQYLGLHAAIGKGVDPDAPRNLTQVVII